MVTTTCLLWPCGRVIQVCMGGEIPDSFHIKPEDLVDKDSITILTIPRSSTRDIEFEVKEIGKVLR